MSLFIDRIQDRETKDYAYAKAKQVFNKCISGSTNRQEITEAIEFIHNQEFDGKADVRFIKGFHELKSLKNKLNELAKDSDWRRKNAFNIVKDINTVDLINKEFGSGDIPYFRNIKVRDQYGRKLINEIFFYHTHAYIDRYNTMAYEKTKDSKYRLNMVFPFVSQIVTINFFNICGLPYTDEFRSRLDALTKISENAYFLLVFDNIYYVMEKPKLHFNEDPDDTKNGDFHIQVLKLHNTSGNAIEFPDGSGWPYINGKKIPNWIFNSKDSKAKTKRILKLNNAELRKYAIDFMGLENFLNHLDHKITDEYEEYQIIIVDISPHSYKEWRPFLIMTNPTTGEKHIEGVDSRIRKVKTALKWRMGLKSYEKPMFNA